MKSAGVIGWPIEHSRSPLIHGYWLKQYGVDGRYTKEPVRPEDLTQFLSSLAARGLSGCNVTVPHKEAAFARADIKDQSAIAVGAANTLWIESGKLHAANTDTYGFMAHLAVEAPHWKRGDRSVAILGAGGAARAIVYGFLQAGVGDVRVFNRSIARAEDLAHHFGSRVKAFAWDAFAADAGDSSVLVNTTTRGMKGEGDIELDLSFLKADCVVADIVYVPLETGLLRRARARGLTTVDGLGMLLHQAVPGFHKWFGVKPEVTPELRALIEADIRGHV
ncbi:MAG: shikimate dehydrogenase [Hyphomicrobium sp.]